MKYKIRTDLSISYKGRALYRIEALKSFNDVEIGAIGGYIESEDNLSQENGCWVYDRAKVYDQAKVYNQARVYGEASAFGEAKIFDEAQLYGQARVFGQAHIYGQARVFGQAYINGQVRICDIDLNNFYQVVSLAGFKYPITITYAYAIIGCKFFTLDKINNVNYKDFERDVTLKEFKFLKELIDINLEYVLDNVMNEE